MDKILPNAKGDGPLQSNPLNFLVLPMRFERMAYRLGGDSKGFHQVSREHTKILTIQ